MARLSVSRRQAMVLTAAFVAGCAQEPAPQEPAQTEPATATVSTTPVACGDLSGRTIAAELIGLPTNGATITNAELKPGTGTAVPEPDFAPEFCMLDGVIESIDASAPDINFRVAVPTEWNGHAVQIGGNGFNGFIPRLVTMIRSAGGSPMGPAYPPNRPFLVAEGYATFGSDSGHVTGNGMPPGWTPQTPGDGEPPPEDQSEPGEVAEGGPPQGGNPFAWMANPEALENYSHAQIKKTHDVAVEIIRQLRGSAPETTYFMGESQGGRDALIAASLYGDDYDGVLVSVPLSYFTGLLVNGSYRPKLQFDLGAYVPRTKQAALVGEVLAQCDSMDALEDGVINNYYACHRRFDRGFTPEPFANLRCPSGEDEGDECFSDGQIGTLEAIFSSMEFGYPLANGETDWPGNAIGAEGAGSSGSLAFLLLENPPDPANPGGFLPIDVMFGGILGDPASFDYFGSTHAELQQQIQAISAILDAPADWSALLENGGKLIYHTAANDYLTNTRSHMLLYEQVVARQGQAAVDEFVRFYVTPNGDHGSAGVSSTTGEPTPGHMDLISVLTNWVENGIQPPDAVPQVLMSTEPPYEITRSRPLCRYPNYPRYTGQGDPDVMESYICSSP